MEERTQKWKQNALMIYLSKSINQGSFLYFWCFCPDFVEMFPCLLHFCLAFLLCSFSAEFGIDFEFVSQSTQPFLLYWFYFFLFLLELNFCELINILTLLVTESSDQFSSTTEEIDWLPIIATAHGSGTKSRTQYNTWYHIYNYAGCFWINPSKAIRMWREHDSSTFAIRCKYSGLCIDWNGIMIIIYVIWEETNSLTF